MPDHWSSSLAPLFLTFAAALLLVSFVFMGLFVFVLRKAKVANVLEREDEVTIEWSTPFEKIFSENVPEPNRSNSLSRFLDVVCSGMLRAVRKRCSNPYIQKWLPFLLLVGLLEDYAFLPQAFFYLSSHFCLFYFPKFFADYWFRNQNPECVSPNEYLKLNPLHNVGSAFRFAFFGIPSWIYLSYNSLAFFLVSLFVILPYFSFVFLLYLKEVMEWARQKRETKIYWETSDREPFETLQRKEMNSRARLSRFWVLFTISLGALGSSYQHIYGISLEESILGLDFTLASMFSGLYSFFIQ